MFDTSRALRRILEAVRLPGRSTRVLIPRAEALAAEAAEPPAVVLLEVSIGALGERLALIRSLRSRDSLGGARLIAVTDRSEASLAEAALAAGADDVLPWPADPAEVRVRIASALATDVHDCVVCRERRNLSRVLKVYRELAASLEPEDVLRAMVGAVADVTFADRASVVRFDERAQSAVVLAASDAPDLRDFPIDIARYPEIGQAMLSCGTVVIDDLASDPMTQSARRWLQDLAGTSVAVTPLDRGSDALGALLLRARRSGRAFAAGEIDMFELIASSSTTALRNAIEVRNLRDERSQLETMCTLDPLTGLLNHSYLHRRLELECTQAGEIGCSIGFIMIDVDEFKSVNDRFGHVVGDDVLRELADTIRRATRRDDVLARYGGEEFAVILPGADLHGAGEQAERLRKVVLEARFAGIPGDTGLTVSLGVASFPAEGTRDAQGLIKDADRALYRAKAAGKNCVCLALA